MYGNTAHTTDVKVLLTKPFDKKQQLHAFNTRLSEKDKIVLRLNVPLLFHPPPTKT